MKFAEASHVEEIYPDGIRHADCQLVRERAVWRLIEGKAVRVGYRIFAGPGGQEPRIPGVTPAAVSLVNVYIEIQAKRRDQAAAI